MRLRHTLLSLLAAMIIMAGTAGAAYAVSDSVSGGTWYHGTTGLLGGGEVYSNFYDPNSYHGSTATGDYSVYSGCKVPGATSYARTDADRFETDYAYYNFC